MHYRCSPPVAEYYAVMSAALTYTLICAVILIVLLISKYSFFRLACLGVVCGEVLPVINAMALCVAEFGSTNERYIVEMSKRAFQDLTFVTMIVAMLDLGQTYRPSGHKNTMLFKYSVAALFAYVLVFIPDAIVHRLTLLGGDSSTATNGLEYATICLRWLVLSTTVLYTFFPVIAIHSNGSHTRFSVDARAAALGTYLLIVATSWFTYIVAFDIVSTQIHARVQPHVFYFVTAVGNATAGLVFGLPAPRCILQRLHKLILGRTFINRVVVVDRGVLSTGILEGRVYETFP